MDEVGGEEVGDRGAVASVQDRARLSSLVELRLLGEGDGDEALLVGRGRRPVGRLQPGELGIIDERAEEEAGVAVGAEAAVAQMLLEGFGRPRHSGCLQLGRVRNVLGFFGRVIRAVRIAATDKRIPRPLRYSPP